MSVAGRDNRQHKRRSLYYYLKVLDRDTGSEMGRLVDIHIAGLLLISRFRLKQDQEYNLRIPLDDETLRSLSGNLDIKAVAKWCKQDINVDYYVIGLQFTDISTVQEDRIEDLVRVIGFK